jgi:hypothetical protein
MSGRVLSNSISLQDWIGGYGNEESINQSGEWKGFYEGEIDCSAVILVQQNGMERKPYLLLIRNGSQ